MRSSSGSASARSTGDGDDRDATAGEPTPPRNVTGAQGSPRCSAAGSSPTVARFVDMGFSEERVAMALEHNGGGRDPEAIVEWLLAHQAMDGERVETGCSPGVGDSTILSRGGVNLLGYTDDHVNEEHFHFHDSEDETDLKSSGYESFSEKGFSSSSEGVDMADFAMDDEEFAEELSEKDRKFLNLVEMGFALDEASSAIDRCGQHEPISVLADAIYAAQMAKKVGVYGGDFGDVELSADETRGLGTSRGVKRKNIVDHLSDKKRHHNKQKQLGQGHSKRAFGSGPMVGFGLPNETMHICNRTLSDIAEGPPYFYFENVACTPKGVWDKMSRFLYDIEPEFVDSKYFCAATRKRGYIHNLPIHGRFPLLPMQPRTIRDAFPWTRKWWPPWDPRTQLNCVQTVMAAATSTVKVRSELTTCDGTPTEAVRKKILDECKKWNLIWVGLNKVAALEPHEVESLLGFPRDHTRGISRKERYKSLGNSFQVDTVAYHLSVLKALFPAGIRVLSLFSGIGGAEVALHRLGIHLKVVVSAEISKMNRDILRSWWEQSEQTGDLIEIGDVQRVTNDYLETLVRRVGGFDMVVGGSPCNNIAGSNRHYRVGLEGEQSGLFYHYFRILEQVRQIMRRM